MVLVFTTNFAQMEDNTKGIFFRNLGKATRKIDTEEDYSKEVYI